MERGEYERMAAVEERSWWFRGLHRNLINAWHRAAGPLANPALLDAGCGTGGLLSQLRLDRAQPRCFGIDLDHLAAATARAKSHALTAIGSAMAVPFASASFDAVFSADVLCHRGVEPAAALQSLGDCLRPGGVLVLNLPAYRWLLSGHDHAVDNVRRFSRGEVRGLLQQTGYDSIRVGYWNSLLFPLMLAQRLTHPHGESDVALLPAPIERLFYAMVELEAWLGNRGLNFPFGGSILATAVKS